MKHIYLERLKRMTPEEVMKECEKHGKVMENCHPMSKEQVSRAYMCFRYAHAAMPFSEDDKRMLATAIRVLKILA